MGVWASIWAGGAGGVCEGRYEEACRMGRSGQGGEQGRAVAVMSCGGLAGGGCTGRCR